MSLQRKGQLHKRQLEEADTNEDSEASKRKKMEETETKMEDSHKETDYYIENGTSLDVNLSVCQFTFRDDCLTL